MNWISSITIQFGNYLLGTYLMGKAMSCVGAVPADKNLNIWFYPKEAQNLVEKIKQWGMWFGSHKGEMFTKY